MLTRHDSACGELGRFRMIWKVSNHNFRVQFVWLVFLILHADLTFAYQREPNSPHVIELFTSAKYPIVETDTTSAGGNLLEPEIAVYELDGIQSVERDLSLKLPAAPQKSKQVALHRIQNLDEQTRSRMQSAAMALAKAMQYGIDRFPAIVFDGQAVVYGVTDLPAALAHYQAWKIAAQP